MHELNDYKKMFKDTWCALIATLGAALTAYNLLIIYGYTNPDGVMEGISYYDNAVVASTMSGRWLVRYLMKGFGGIVNPLLCVLFYALCVYVSMVMIKAVWRRFDKVSLCLACVALIVSPSVITQFSYLYMSPAYGLCCLLACLYIYAAFEFNSYLKWIVGASAIACMLGLYQSYIGMAAVLAAMSLIIISDKEETSIVLKRALDLIIIAVLGSVLYFVILKIDNAIYGVFDGGRIGNISLSVILSNLGSSLVYVYKQYLAYYADYMLRRKYVYLLLFVIMAYAIAKQLYVLLKGKQYLGALIVLALALLLPLLNNIAYIAFPENAIGLPMEFQNILVVPFALALVSVEKSQLLKGFTNLLVVYLCWTLILCANATYRCYQLSYDSLNRKMEMLVDDIIHTEGYEENETTVLIYGFFDDAKLRQTNDNYKYAIDFPENVAFWIDNNGVNFGRRNYFLNFFGIDFQIIDNGWVYDYYLYDGPIKEMPVWPAEGSIRMSKEGYLLVKITEDPIDCYWD